MSNESTGIFGTWNTPRLGSTFTGPKMYTETMHFCMSASSMRQIFVASLDFGFAFYIPIHVQNVQKHLGANEMSSSGIL